jgi:hypothetical protein
MCYSSSNLLHCCYFTFCSAGSPDEASVLAAAAAAAIGTPLQQPQQQQQQQASQDPAADVDDLQEGELLHQGALPGELQPTIATTNPALLGTNVLHELDRAVQVRQLYCFCVVLVLPGRLWLQLLPPTVYPALLGTNVLHELDRVVQVRQLYRMLCSALRRCGNSFRAVAVA